MNDPHGFMRHPREDARKQPVHSRLRHWGEYVDVIPESQARRQATRCMDCGIPYCHAQCPVHNLIPDWNALVHEHQWRSAYEQLDATNNFPEFTGRLCPAPCEQGCTLKLNDSPVSIKNIELAISEHAWDAGWVRPARAQALKHRRVAVVGSGPAGLACAQQLQRTGLQATLFEKADRIGGLLRYGIPDFRLDKAVLDRRLQQMAAEGVEFVTGADVGNGLPVAQLIRDFDAVVLACGCEHPRDLRVEGRELAGIHFAMDYLERQNRRIAGDPGAPQRLIDAGGLDVMVIGGGDTGGDCQGTAIRQGARSVTQVQYHDQPPVQGDVLRYWPDPTPECQITDHEEEGCGRIWGWDTVAFEDDGHGRVSAVHMQRLQWQEDGNGGWRKQPLPGQTRRLPAQLVLIATGFAHPRRPGLIEDLGLPLDTRGRVAANDADYQTGIPGVFSCGDMRRGQSLVVWAIREGRQCARAVDQWLSLDSDLPRV